MWHTLRRIAKVTFKPASLIGAGGAGRDVALLVSTLRAERVCNMLGLDGELRASVHDLILRLTQRVYLDSDRWEGVTLDAPFAGSEALSLTTPAEYVPLSSPSGRAIIERVGMPPFSHLQGWELLPHVKDKMSDSEAQGNRLYGLVNALVSARYIGRLLSDALVEMENSIKGEDWLRLAERGVRLDGGRCINIFTSISGGQGSGLLVFILSYIALLIEKTREEYEVNIHLFLPGFHQAQNDAKKRDQSRRALSVLRDLRALKAGCSLEIPFPGGNLRLNEIHTSELFNRLFVYQPRASQANLYNSFISRVSSMVVDAELSALSSDLRRDRSNAIELARETDVLAVTNGWKVEEVESEGELEMTFASR